MTICILARKHVIRIYKLHNDSLRNEKCRQDGVERYEVISAPASYRSPADGGCSGRRSGNRQCGSRKMQFGNNLARLVYSTFRNVNKFSNLLAMKPIAFESNKTEVLSNFSKGLCQIGFYSLAFLVGCLFYHLLPPSPGLRPKAMIMTEGLKIVRSGQFSTLGDIPEVVSDTLNPGPEAFGSTKIHIGINLRNENLEFLCLMLLLSGNRPYFSQNSRRGIID